MKSQIIKHAKPFIILTKSFFCKFKKHATVYWTAIWIDGLSAWAFPNFHSSETETHCKVIYKSDITYPPKIRKSQELFEGWLCLRLPNIHPELGKAEIRIKSQIREWVRSQAAGEVSSGFPQLEQKSVVPPSSALSGRSICAPPLLSAWRRCASALTHYTPTPHDLWWGSADKRGDVDHPHMFTKSRVRTSYWIVFIFWRKIAVCWINRNSHMAFVCGSALMKCTWRPSVRKMIIGRFQRKQELLYLFRVLFAVF